MRKQDFIKELRLNLSFLPKEEIDDRISFYSELIDDKIEEGVKEEDAIKSIGSIDEIINQIIDEMPLSKIAKDKIKPKRKLRGLEIALIIVGYLLSYSLAISIVLSLEPSLTTIISTSSPPITKESKHLAKYASEL